MINVILRWRKKLWNRKIFHARGKISPRISMERNKSFHRKGEKLIHTLNKLQKVFLFKIIDTKRKTRQREKRMDRENNFMNVTTFLMMVFIKKKYVWRWQNVMGSNSFHRDRKKNSNFYRKLSFVLYTEAHESCRFNYAIVKRCEHEKLSIFEVHNLIYDAQHTNCQWIFHKCQQHGNCVCNF